MAVRLRHISKILGVSMPKFTLVGCSTQGASVFKINATTGVGTLVGKAGLGAMNSLACDSSGKLFSTNGDTLIRINPQTGTGSLGKKLPTAHNDVRDLAFSQRT